MVVLWLIPILVAVVGISSDIITSTGRELFGYLLVYGFFGWLYVKLWKDRATKEEKNEKKQNAVCRQKYPKGSVAEILARNDSMR